MDGAKIGDLIPRSSRFRARLARQRAYRRAGLVLLALIAGASWLWQMEARRRRALLADPIVAVTD